MSTCVYLLPAGQPTWPGRRWAAPRPLGLQLQPGQHLPFQTVTSEASATHYSDAPGPTAAGARDPCVGFPATTCVHSSSCSGRSNTSCPAVTACRRLPASSSPRACT
ncbi:hypothetical protein Pcinc_030184 [Petrolisthes cinctipes]|uniref:Uncharacterized protein n=1 Tax=Petrolisthes cinctipes TaxID=88211 RepID=A0AAE1EZC2_PETCI|nr:hypothetical protein Pcinc_030184 [Petrolisthes cinctipes]